MKLFEYLAAMIEWKLIADPFLSEEVFIFATIIPRRWPLLPIWPVEVGKEPKDFSRENCRWVRQVAWKKKDHTEITGKLPKNGGNIWFFKAGNMVWYDMIWYDMNWYDMIWYDMTHIYDIIET